MSRNAVCLGNFQPHETSLNEMNLLSFNIFRYTNEFATRGFLESLFQPHHVGVFITTATSTARFTTIFSPLCKPGFRLPSTWTLPPLYFSRYQARSLVGNPGLPHRHITHVRLLLLLAAEVNDPLPRSPGPSTNSSDGTHLRHQKLLHGHHPSCNGVYDAGVSCAVFSLLAYILWCLRAV
jgi:hypothetical protein